MALVLALATLSVTTASSGSASAAPPPRLVPTGDAMPAALRAAVATVTDNREFRLNNGGHMDSGHYEMGYSVAISGNWAVVGLPDATVSGGGNSGEVLAFQRTGTDWKLRRNFNLFSLGANDRYGESVAIAGNHLLIGVPGANLAGADSGRVEAWQYASGQWQRIGIFAAPDSNAGDRFGSTVSLDGAVAVIGSPGVDNGVVDMFVRSGSDWQWKTRVSPNDLTAGADFGASIDVDGNYVAIGAPEANSGAGRAFTYLRSGNALNRQAELFPEEVQASSRFGFDVALDGTWAAVTQPTWDHVDGRTGSVSSFQRSGTAWPRKDTITGSTTDVFATAVDVSGTNALVGRNSSTIVPFTRASTGLWTAKAPVDVPDVVSALAISGNYGVYGAPSAPGFFGEPNIGAAGILFRAGNGTWSQQDRLQVPSAQVDEKFGYSVAYDNTGTWAVVGAPGSNNGAGAAYLFRSNGDIMWHFQARFEADTPTPGAGFGSSVSMNGAYVVVGAPNEGNGAAYVFFRAGSGTEWTRQARIVPAAGGPAHENFGHSVAINGAYAAVGAPGDASTAGRSYTFLRSGTTWAQQATMAPTGTVPTDGYGTSVALEGTSLVVGSPGDNAGIGAAYVWVRSGTNWPFKTMLTPTGGAAGDKFGTSVDISGARVVVGAPDDSDWQPLAGAAYVFTRATSGPWPQVQIEPLTPGPTGDFGWDVAIDQERILVGDPTGPNTFNNMGGRAFHFRLGTTWSIDQILTQNFTNDLDNDSQCGLSVDLSHTPTSNAGGNDFGIVGCPQLTTAMGEAGKAFIYYP